MKKKLIAILTASVLVVLSSCGTKALDLSPANWGSGELEKYIRMDSRELPDNPLAVGKNGAVTTTYYATAARAGLEALKQGGSSVDAAMTTALTQITLGAGSVISFFGIMDMVHYDAATGEIVSMDACWNTIQNETDPMSIPGVDVSRMMLDYFLEREVSGRTALVGGFMKGVEAAHQRYGKLPFEQIFEPSIYLAENGFELATAPAAYFKSRDKQIRRLPETRVTLVKPDGSGYQAGDIFKQPALAETLRRIAEEGSDYMYKGEWAEKAVAAVQADGGKMTLKDLVDYEVIWSEPIKAEYGDYEVAVTGPPVIGSVNLIEALNLAFAAEIPELGHWSENGESLRRISDVTSMASFSYLSEAMRNMVYPNLDLSDESRLKKETSEELWKRMEKGVKIVQYADVKPRHSDTVVVIDQWGNMTAVTHSINCICWGNEAIVVDGVSIGDPASFQQAQIKAAGPGKRLPSPIEVGIISKNGTPLLPFASMAMGLHQQTVQSILNIISFDMNVKDAVDAPCIFLPLTDMSNPMQPKNTVRVMVGDFPADVIEASGLPVEEIPATVKARRFVQGLWIGIYRNPETGELEAASPPYASGRALAY